MAGWSCPGCDRRFGRRNQPHAHVHEFRLHAPEDVTPALLGLLKRARDRAR
jgi:hypothetical protein